MKRHPQVAIIGGGIAGLTAATCLRRQGIPFTLFEAAPQLAGMARSHSDADGFSYDFGAHFITNRLAAAIGVSGECRDVKYYGESVLLDEGTYSYPFGLMAVPRFLASAVKSKLAHASTPTNAAEWFRAAYGRTLADEVALPLVEAWSGAPGAELAVAVGNKLSHGPLYLLYLRLASRWKGLAISSGYSHEMPENPSVWHVYPEGGVARLCDRLAEPFRDSIEMESPVERIYVESGKAVGLRVRGEDRPVSGIVSTLPCPVLAKIVEGTDALAGVGQFRFRPMVLVNLKMNGRGLLADTVLWLPKTGAPYFRLTETTQSMPWLAPEGKTIITCDIGDTVGGEHWKMTDEQLGALCVEHLAERLVPDAKSRYLGCRALRTPIAYPVFLNSYEARRQSFQQSTGIENLISIGRNGEFAHILMEDIYWKTQRKMAAFMETAAPRALSAA